jgi:WD40 repeat protein
LAPAGQSLAVLFDDGGLVVIDVATGKLRWEDSDRLLSAGPERLCFSPDGQFVAAWGAMYARSSFSQSTETSGAVVLWNAATGQPRQVIDADTRSVACAAFSPDGKTLVTSGRDRAVKFWDPVAAQLRLSLPLTSDEWKSYVVRPLPEFAVKMLGEQGQEYLDAETGGIDLGPALETRELPAVHDLAFTPDGSVLAVASSLHGICLWPCERSPQVASFGDHAGPVRCLQVSPNGKLLASASAGQVKLHDLRSAMQLAAWETSVKEPTLLVFSPGGEYLALAGTTTITAWNLASRQVGFVTEAAAYNLYSAAFTRDGQSLYAAGADGQLHCWDVDTGRLTRSIATHQPRVYALALAANDKEAILSGPSSVTGLQLDSGQYQAVARISNASQLRPRTSTTPGGRWLAVQDFGLRTVQILDLQTGVVRGRIDTGPALVDAIQISPDGKLVAGTSGHGIRVWSTETGQPTHNFSNAGQPATITFSPDGRQLVHGSYDGTLRVWRLD